LAREKGEVRFSDIAKEEHTYLEKVKSNTTTKKLGLVSSAKHLKQTNFEYMRTIWNSPKYGKSPYKYFDKILIPTGIDQKGDVVYKFNQKKYEGGNS
jgi:hypothetical protein